MGIGGNTNTGGAGGLFGSSGNALVVKAHRDLVLPIIVPIWSGPIKQRIWWCKHNHHLVKAIRNNSQGYLKWTGNAFGSNTGGSTFIQTIRDLELVVMLVNKEIPVWC